MAEHTQYMNELTCAGCGKTGHITWEGAGAQKRVVNMSDNLKQQPGTPPTFTCIACGTMQRTL
jgi:hypothetical protein